MALDISKCRNR